MLSMRPKLPKQSCSSAECCEMLRMCVREGTCKIFQDNEWHVWFAVYFEHRNEMFLGQTSRFPNYHYSNLWFVVDWVQHFERSRGFGSECGVANGLSLLSLVWPLNLSLRSLMALNFWGKELMRAGTPLQLLAKPCDLRLKQHKQGHVQLGKRLKILGKRQCSNFVFGASDVVIFGFVGLSISSETLDKDFKTSHPPTGLSPWLLKQSRASKV